MKKIGSIIAGISLFMLLLGTGVWADITLTDTGGGPGFTYETSPNVDMDYDDNGTDVFLITSVNTKGTIEYGIVSSFSGYYQHTVDLGSNATPVNQGTIEGWTAMNFD